MASDGSVIIKIDGDDSGFKSALQGLGGAAKAGGIIAAKAISGIGAALTTGAAAAVKIGMDFEASMSNVSAISGATGEDLEALTAKAEEMGATTKFSASEAADALSYMAMAGWKTEDMLNGIDGVMNLAAASGEDLATTSDIVTDALTAFGMTAQESGRLADVMAAASSNANTNVSLLGETFKYVAPVAGALGYSCEDTAVAIGLMANSGIKGSQAGTSLRAIMTRLAKPTDEVAGCMERLGISLTDSAGEILPLSNLVSQLREKFAGLEDAQKTEYAASLAGQEAMSGLLAIVNASDSDFEKLTTAIDNSSGSAKRMADTMNDNLKGRLTELGSAAEGFAIQVYDAMEGPLKNGVEAAISSVGTLSKEMSDGNLHRSTQKLATSFGNIIESGTELASDVLPGLVDGFAEVLNHGKQIVVMYGTMKTAALGFKAASQLNTLAKGWKAATAAIEAHEAAQRLTLVAMNGGLPVATTLVGVLTGKISLATAAQGAWNAVTAANPYVLLGAAIAAVTVGIGAYILAQDKEIDKTREVIDATQATIDKYDELRDSTNEAISAGLAECDNADYQVQKFKALADQTGIVREGTDEYAKAKAAASEINAVYPGAIEELEDEEGAYLKVSDAIDLLIAKKRAEQVLDAGAEQYQKTNEALADYARDRKTIQDDIERTTQEYNDKIALLCGQDAAQQAIYEQERDAALQELGKRYDEIGTKMQRTAEDAQRYEALQAAAVTGNVEEINAALEQYESKLIHATDTNTAACLQQVQDTQQQADEIASVLGESSDRAQYFRDTAREASDIAADAIMQMVSKFADGKTGAVQNIEEMNSALREAMSGLKEPLSSEAANAVGASIAAMLVETYGAKAVGENFAQGYYDGLFSSLGIADDVAAQLVTDAIDAAREAQDSHSPSRVMAEEGRNFADGFAQGISDNSTAGDNGATSLVNSALTAAQNALSGVPVVGGLFSTLLGSGISSSGSVPYSAASSVAAGAALAASSKSSLFGASGSLFMSSTAGGIYGASRYVRDAASSAASDAAKNADTKKTLFQGAGQAYMSLMNAAVRTGGVAVAATSKQVAINTLAMAKHNQSSFSSAGSAMASGLAAGIRNGAAAAINAARNLAISALNTAKKALGINSPSRVMRDQVGRWIPAGIAAGIEQHTSTVMDAMRGIGAQAGKEFNTSVQDELDAMSLKMRGAVDAETASVARAARSSASESTIKRQNNQEPRGDINIYQTNNSPKALSRRDIYRQTKRAAKEAAAHA